MDAFRLFLHVLAASIWVGGQLVLAGLVPTVRRFGEDATRQVARAFNRIAWPAYGVAVVTGLWNVFDLPLEDLRDELSPIRVLHEAVTLAGIADMGPMLPHLSNLPPAEHPRIRSAAATLLAHDRSLPA